VCVCRERTRSNGYPTTKAVEHLASLGAIMDALAVFFFLAQIVHLILPNKTICKKGTLMSLEILFSA
jgi:hypothetical protein